MNCKFVNCEYLSLVCPDPEPVFSSKSKKWIVVIVFAITCPRYPRQGNIFPPRQSGIRGSTKLPEQEETPATLNNEHNWMVFLWMRIGLKWSCPIHRRVWRCGKLSRRISKSFSSSARQSVQSLASFNEQRYHPGNACLTSLHIDFALLHTSGATGCADICGIGKSAASSLLDEKFKVIN